MPQAPVPVTLPPPVGLRYGLFTAAVGPLTLPDHADNSGVQYDDSLGCGTAGVWPLACPVPDGLEKEPIGASNWREALPFAVYLYEQCLLVGRSLAEAEQHVRQRFAAVEQTAVERVFWRGDTAAGVPAGLATADATVLPPADDLVTALGELEQWLASTYGYPGYIHAPAYTAASAADHSLIVKDGPLLRTPLGNVWVFGGGYDGSGPAGQAPAAGRAWLYATGRVFVWRGDVLVPPLDQVFDKASNDVNALAERVYAVGAECGTAVVDAGGAGTGVPGTPVGLAVTPSEVTVNPA